MRNGRREISCPFLFGNIFKLKPHLTFKRIQSCENYAATNYNRFRFFGDHRRFC